MIGSAVVRLVFVGGVVFAAGPEWGQWAGPNRNFQVAGRHIAETWPQSGPGVVWKRPLPYGSSSVVVDGNRLYTMYRDGDNEVVVALDAATGRTLWEIQVSGYVSEGHEYEYGAW